MTNPLAPLLAWRQWIIVRLVPLASGLIDKLPIDYRTGHVTPKGNGGAHNPEIWLDYASAAAGAVALGPTNHTVGFVLTPNDPFFCVDIDSARLPSGEWAQSALALCRALPGTVIEASVSGKGLHIWGQGAVPPHSAGNEPLGTEQGVVTSAALYTDLRFMVIGTGANGDMTQPCPTIAQVAANVFPPRASRFAAPAEGPSPEWRGPTDDDELLRRALQSRSAGSVFGQRASFADLWDCNVAVLSRTYPSTNGDEFDRSAADMALASHLAFWTGRDQARIERLMRRSKLVREKWDQRDDYLVGRTIGGACGMCREVLQDKPPEPAALPGPAAPAPATTPASTTPQGSTYLSPQDQVEYFKGCIYIIALHKALVPGGDTLNPDRFKATFGGRMFQMDNRNEKVSRNAWEAFTENQAVTHPRAHDICFRPWLPYGTLVQDGDRVLANSWWPVTIKRTQGDPAPFVRHVQSLLPNGDDALILLSYMAAIVQHVGIKFAWAPLIQGVEGNGKTLFSRVAEYCVGTRYTHWPKASKIAKQFNGWMPGKLLYCVEDVYTKEHVDVLEELKPMIAGGSNLEIEKKGIDQISQEIVGNFILNTNHKDALKKTRNERRICPLFCAQQNAEDLLRDGITEDHISGLYDWLKRGGYAIVYDYLMTFQIPDRYNPAKNCVRAPRTTSTEAAIEASYGRIEQEIQEAIAQEELGFRGGWISSVFLETLLQRMGRSGALAPSRRADALRDLGYVLHPALPDGRTNNPVMPDNKKPRLFLRRDHQALALRNAADVARAYTLAQGVGSSGVPSPK